MTETLYHMVKNWTKQPWDGIRYLNITQKLGELLDDESHSEKYLGAIIGVLEGTIKSVHEMMHDEILTDTEGIQHLRKLLRDSDFRKGAKRIEVIQTDFDTEVVISIPNLKELSSIKMSEKCSSPIWWKGSIEKFWFFIIGIYLGVAFSIYSILMVLGLLELSLIATFCIGPIGAFIIAYYFRRIKYPSVFRSTLTVGTIIAGGSWLCFIIPLFLFPNAVSKFLFQLLSVIIYGMIIGGFLGEWLGKRQSYMSYF